MRRRNYSRYYDRTVITKHVDYLRLCGLPNYDMRSIYIDIIDNFELFLSINKIDDDNVVFVDADTKRVSTLNKKEVVKVGFPDGLVGVYREQRIKITLFMFKSSKRNFDTMVVQGSGVYLFSRVSGRFIDEPDVDFYNRIKGVELKDFNKALDKLESCIKEEDM